MLWVSPPADSGGIGVRNMVPNKTCSEQSHQVMWHELIGEFDEQPINAFHQSIHALNYQKLPLISKQIQTNAWRPQGVCESVGGHSRRLNSQLTRPTLFWIHCVHQEGGRMQGWESVVWWGFVVFSTFERFKDLIGQNTKIPHDVTIIPKVSTCFQNIVWFNRIY